MSAPASPFHDLDHYVALPRVSGLALSPDGTRLVTTVATLNRKGTGYASALWELDPTGVRPAHRITRSSKGEAGAAFGIEGGRLARFSPDGSSETAPSRSSGRAVSPASVVPWADAAPSTRTVKAGMAIDS